MKYINLVVSEWNSKIDNDFSTVYLSEYAKPNNFKDSIKEGFVFEHHWNNKSKAESDSQYIKGLKEKLLPELAKKLNELNKTNLSVKGWNLIIGNWLISFLTVSFDRYYSL